MTLPIIPPWAKLAAIVAVLLGAYLWIDHRGYARGYEAKNAEVLKEAARYTKQAVRVNAALATAQAERGDALNARLDDTRTQGDRLQTIILKVRRAIAILLASLPMACSQPSTLPVGYLVVPRLTPRAASPCRPLPTLADRKLGTLAAEDAVSSTLYAGCQEKHASVVASYQAIYDAAERVRAR